MTNKRATEEEVIYECYRRLFKSAAPSANFDKLMDQSQLNKFGRKEIPFMNYVSGRDTLSDCRIELTIKTFELC
jgi:hypothetical protein